MAEWSKAADCKSADTVYEGSNPSPTTISYNEADLAQQVEHIHGKDGVSGSSPEVGSSNSKASRLIAGGLYFYRISYVCTLSIHCALFRSMDLERVAGTGIPRISTAGYRNRCFGEDPGGRGILCRTV